MHHVIYNNKLEDIYTLTPLDPRLLYVDPIQAKRYLSFRDTCLHSYSYRGQLSVLCVPYLAAYSNVGHLSVLYRMHVRGYWSGFNMQYTVLGSFQ